MQPLCVFLFDSSNPYLSHFLPSFSPSTSPLLGDGVLLGAGATILGNVQVGRGSLVGACSLVLEGIMCVFVYVLLPHLLPFFFSKKIALLMQYSFSIPSSPSSLSLPSPLEHWTVAVRVFLSLFHHYLPEFLSDSVPPSLPPSLPSFLTRHWT